MVKVRANAFLAMNGEIEVEQWLEQLADKGYLPSLDIIRSIYLLIQNTKKICVTSMEVPCLQLGIAMADTLADLKVDQDTLLAAILFESVSHSALSIEEVEECLGEKHGPPVMKLIRGIEKMSAIKHLQVSHKGSRRKAQINNLRKMLLAMVDDARVVLIKLAERLCLLRVSNHFSPALQQEIAHEAMDIYAPLANRLGVGAIKWEMEDLAFKVLEPVSYMEIAKGLNAKRLDRDHYIALVIGELKSKIKEIGIDDIAIYGRSKHIHSIYRKMKRKNVALDEIYDATAIRILADRKEQCYELLSLVHTLWKQVPKEFDDYIVNPKPNGYQSLHTAVIGPFNRIFEVQIRTFQMHERAEMGIAAHWRYKEGVHSKTSHERKIEWLRGVLAWHEEMANTQEESKELTKEFLEDRVYLLSPSGDVFDLPQGSTPLDFAYHLHTQIGHRCRGAKVNHHIVPLTSVLKTGDSVEILTGKEERPSRDWVNPHRHFLTTSRARSKVFHWFKMQDYDKDKKTGQELAEKALKPFGIKVEHLAQTVTDYYFKRLDDLLAALGRGDIKMSHILSRRSLQKLLPHEFSPQLEDDSTVEKLPNSPKSIEKSNLDESERKSDLRIEGVDNLLTHKARCCEPELGDEVIGYITVGRGISIHKQDCPNIVRASKKQQERFLQVHWKE